MFQVGGEPYLLFAVVAAHTATRRALLDLRHLSERYEAAIRARHVDLP